MEKPGRNFAGRWLLLIVAAAVAILFIQAVSYSGLMRSLAEWQFVRFGRYFPVFTIILFAGLVALIWSLLVLVRRRARKETPPVTLSRLAFRWRSAGMFLGIASGVLAIVAIGVFIHYLRAPRDSASIRIANLSQAQGASFTPGPTRLEGIRALGPVGLYTEDVLFSSRTYYFVPVGRDANGAFNLFVEIDDPQAQRFPESTTGLLRSDALPSEFAQMYRINRMAVAPESAVLFRDAQSADRPILVLLGEVALFAVSAALFAFLCRRRARKIERESDKAVSLAKT